MEGSEGTEAGKRSGILVAPSILAADFGNLESEIVSVAESGADLLHIDVMDGAFVPPITFGDNMVRLAASVSSLFLESHLMVVEPHRHFELFAQGGSNRILFHYEACPKKCEDNLKALRDLGIEGGVAINPETSVDAIKDLVPKCDMVLVMSVTPGWAGQKFNDNAIEKIHKLAKIAAEENPDLLIGVDGGINYDTGRACAAAGANILVSGSFIFNSSDRALLMDKLRRQL